MSKDYKAIRAEIIEREKIKVTSVFVPFSQSRNKNEKHKSLNWKVSVWRGDHCAVTTDYSAGCGHCHSYKNPPKLKSGRVDEYLQRLEIASECEDGFPPVRGFMGGFVTHMSKKQAVPEAESVLYSIITDSDVLNYARFEDWASDFGYDTDSREAEKTYKACLDIALQVRAVFGEALLNELREAFHDY